MDHQLVEGIAERLRGRDPAAVESLVVAFHRPVYRFLVCRGVDSVLAEELTAETFYQLMQGFANFRGNDKQVRAFVYATARNVRSGYHRKSSRLELSCEATENAIATDASPMQRVLVEEQNQQLSEAIGQLTDAAKEIVLLRFVEDLSVNEIASACSLPVGTVKSHLHRAKQELKRMLTKTENQR